MKKLVGVTLVFVVLAVLMIVPSALATPGSGINTSTLSLGRFEEIDVRAHDARPHQVKLKTKGESDVYVVSNTVAPGATPAGTRIPAPA
jgi:hypothetical protein